MINKLYIKLIFIFSAIFFFSACEKKCVDPDNFGQVVSTYVSSFAKAGEKEFEALDGQRGDGKHGNQAITWIDTGLKTDGQPLVVKITGKWINSNGTNGSNDAVPEARVCGNFVKQKVTGIDGSVEDCDSVVYSNTGSNDVTVTNSEGKSTKYGAPCWSINGYALYVLFFDNRAAMVREIIAVNKKADEGIITEAQKKVQVKDITKKYHPNGNLGRMRNPTHPTMNLYNPRDDNEIEQNPAYFWSNDHEIKGQGGANVALAPNWGIFVKIVDGYYYDNAGGYKLDFVSGFKKIGTIGPFETARGVVSGKLSSAAKKIFVNLTSNTDYISAVQTCMVLFILLTTSAYMLGIANISFGDVVTRIAKLMFVGMLISPQSWSFFNSLIFDVFINGTNEVIGIIASYIGSYSPETPFDFADDFFKKFFSKEVWDVKMGSIMSVNPYLGWTWVLILLIIICLVCYLMIQVFCIYIASIIAICFIVSMAPILLTTILIPPLKSVYQAFFTLLLNYAMQAILIVTLLIFLLTTVTTHLYRTLGFPACINNIMNFEVCIIGICVDLGTIQGWAPGEKSYTFKTYYPLLSMKDRLDKHGQQASYTVRYEIGDVKKEIPIPPSYVIKERRNVNLPFLSLTHDVKILDDILVRGNILDFGEVFIVLLIAFICLSLRGTVLEVAQLVSGANPFNPNAGAVFAGFMSGGIIGGMVQSAKARMQDAIGRRADYLHTAFKNPIYTTARAAAMHSGTAMGKKIAGSGMLDVLRSGSTVAAKAAIQIEQNARHSLSDKIGSRLSFIGKGHDLVEQSPLKFMKYTYGAPLRALNPDFGHFSLFDDNIKDQITSAYKDHVNVSKFMHNVYNQGGTDYMQYLDQATIDDSYYTDTDYMDDIDAGDDGLGAPDDRYESGPSSESESGGNARKLPSSEDVVQRGGVGDDSLERFKQHNIPDTDDTGKD